MQHFKHINSHLDSELHADRRLKNALSGRFYTGFPLARTLANDLLGFFSVPADKHLSIVDPFCGDGRLIGALLDLLASKADYIRKIHIELWDIDRDAVFTAKSLVKCHKANDFFDISVDCAVGDSFSHGMSNLGQFDLVITNPPWENLKPDRREIGFLSDEEASRYKNSLREYDVFLCEKFPLSTPAKRFAGWGLNLSRPGIELSQRLLKQGGSAGIVCPASFLADQNSYKLRSWLIKKSFLAKARYFPAEAKLFSDADVQSASIILNYDENRVEIPVVKHGKNIEEISSFMIGLDEDVLNDIDYALPVSLGSFPIEVLRKISHLKRLSDFANEDNLELRIWAGREVDETNLKQNLSNSGTHLFVKGKMIRRYRIHETPTQFFKSDKQSIPNSTSYSRLVWRDVSRPSQARRVQAAIIPSGWVAGNSLGVLHFNNGNEDRLKTLLVIFNSLVFELQLRFHLSTGHVTLSSLRKGRIPTLELTPEQERIIQLHLLTVAQNEDSENFLEAIAALLYGLAPEEFLLVADCFDSLSDGRKKDICQKMNELKGSFAKKETIKKLTSEELIPNHHSPKLSELDLQIAMHVPVGGNWKNVPEEVPSKRLHTIRESFARGEGSRSTYYGRLRPDAPSYTINTYFTRPGNGCHLHYDFEGGQHRVLSYREAARFQSFPDHFKFLGSRTSIAKQIGNAVPPILAYQLSKAVGRPGVFIDLFSGAGGLSYGFVLAGWRCLLANDIDNYALQTHSNNVHGDTVLGDIRDDTVKSQIISIAQSFRKRSPTTPLWVIGGPPCQGFSTAGKKRSMEDERNHLFWDYKTIIQSIQPDGFIFENVSGILSMEKGAAFQQIKEELSECMPKVEHWIVSSENYAVPQRRKRVIIVGSEEAIARPPEVTSFKTSVDLFHNKALREAVSCEEAIGDLPALTAGENGCQKQYLFDAKNPYQKFMRGEIDISEYIAWAKS